jgi:hypothetical protein
MKLRGGRLGARRARACCRTTGEAYTTKKKHTAAKRAYNPPTIRRMRVASVSIVEHPAPEPRQAASIFATSRGCRECRLRARGKELPFEGDGVMSRNSSSDNLDKSDDGCVVTLYLDRGKIALKILDPRLALWGFPSCG